MKIKKENEKDRGSKEHRRPLCSSQKARRIRYFSDLVRRGQPVHDYSSFMHVFVVNTKWLSDGHSLNIAE